MQIRDKAKIAMRTGVVFVLLGIGLAMWGPQNETMSYSTSYNESSAVDVNSMNLIREPALPVDYLMGTGAVLFVAGFLFRARRS